MKISSASNNTVFKTNYTKKPSFKSILSDITPQNSIIYEIIGGSNPHFTQLRLSSTRIFRALSSQNAITKMLPKNEKSEIKILGCSDGSEAWAYAIMAKENMGENAKNVNVTGVDKADYLIETAKTGKIMCSDIEKNYAANEPNVTGLVSPLFLDGWNKYLTKCPRPKEVEALQQKYPCMRYIDFNPIEGTTLGNGNNWYDINKEGLPKVSFKTGDMFDNLEPENKEVKNVVYVIANTAAYLLEENPAKFVKLFSDIKEKNKGKNVYVVLGKMEYIVLKDPNPRFILNGNLRQIVNNAINSLGYKNISEDEAKKFGSIDYKEIAAKITKLQ